MSDVLYDVPNDEFNYKLTYPENRQSAFLAKEALSTRLRLEAYEPDIQQRVATWSDPVGSLTGDPVMPTKVSGMDYGGSLHHSPGLDKSSEVLSDSMSVEDHLAFLSMAELADFLRPLIERVEELVELAGAEEDQQALNPLSLRGFFRFLYLHRSRIMSRPQLILTTEGLLRAIWRRSRDHRIGIRFLDDRVVSFVTFLPDSARPTQINRVGGESSIDGFFRCVSIDSLRD